MFRGSSEPQTINSDDLVVGDIIKLESGQKVPADCIIIESHDLACSEADLTGEPESVKKEVVTN